VRDRGPEGYEQCPIDGRSSFGISLIRSRPANRFFAVRLLEAKRPQLPSAYAETDEILIRLKSANRVGLVEEIAARYSQEQAVITGGQSVRHAAIRSDRISTRSRDSARSENVAADVAQFAPRD